jgi:hypothetical protein
MRLYEEEKIRDIGRFIYKSHISEDYFINFADGSAKVQISADIVYRYGKRIGESKLSDLGIYAFHAFQSKYQNHKTWSMIRQLSALFICACKMSLFRA